MDILLIEDNPGDTRLVQEMVKGFDTTGVNLACEDSLGAGLERLSRESFDVLLLDLGLPDSQGIETLKRAARDTNEIPIIVLTGLADQETAVEALREGAQDYLPKGQFDEDMLARSMRYAIERKRLNDRMVSLIEKNADAIVVVGGDGLVLYLNPAAERMLGESIEEMKGERLGYGLQSGSTVAIRSGPEPYQLRYAEMVVTDLEWELKRASLVTLRDVSDRMVTEQALAESEKKYRSLVENLQEGIWAIDADARTFYVNEQMAEMLGYTVEEMNGAPLFRFMDESWADKARGLMERRMNGIKEKHDFIFRRKDGGAIHTMVATSPILNDDGEVVGALAAVSDISDMKKAEEAAARHLEELRTMIEIAAHEIRHPATVFKGYSTLLLENWEEIDIESKLQCLRSIRNAANRLAGLLNRLFDTAKIERGQLDMTRAEVAPGRLMEKVVDQAGVPKADRDIKISSECEDCVFSLDPDKVGDILEILIDNAIKHTPDGSPIEVWCRRNDGELVFSVADRGPGIPEPDRERVFERFYQVEEIIHHSTPGLGLGLYVAKTYVEAHGGWIKAEPRDGGGSVFSFGIPVA